MKPQFLFRVSVLYKHDKSKVYDCTDFPNLSGDWLTLYQYSKRIIIPTQGIAEIEYDIVKA